MQFDIHKRKYDQYENQSIPWLQTELNSKSLKKCKFVKEIMAKML